MVSFIDDYVMASRYQRRGPSTPSGHVLNIIHGIAAIGDSEFFTENATYIVDGLRTWGWVMLIIGVIELSGSNLSDLEACSELLAERSITAFSGR